MFGGPCGSVPLSVKSHVDTRTTPPKNIELTQALVCGNRKWEQSGCEEPVEAFTLKISLPSAGGMRLRSKLKVGSRKMPPHSPDFRSGQSGPWLCSVGWTSLPVRVEGFGCDWSSESQLGSEQRRLYLVVFSCGVLFCFLPFTSSLAASKFLFPLPKRAASVYDPII